jgi:hypothetical protein
MVLPYIMILLMAIIGAVLLVFLKESTLFASEILTYQTKIVDKKKELIVIPVPVVIPVQKFFLSTKEGIALEVDHVLFGRISIGDLVSVTRYSNGIHRLARY